MKHSKIGRGKTLSIPKAALVEFMQAQREDNMSFVYTGDIHFFHNVIDRAGAKHCGPDTMRQVMICLRDSPLWERSGTIQGWGNRLAGTYRPSKRGNAWLQRYLK